MKLQKLTIHNITSIEDAVIDFEVEPLHSSEVFLITGKTGSGKSTILDAICLALYADTPRLHNTLMEGKITDSNREIDISSPTQLMRRNTGEAFVALTFIGNNNVHYEALWYVQRAHKKPTGNLQNKRWQLTNLDDNTLFSKDKDIEKEIKSAIGLDFKQFCRTVMLAQGEFTRFLNSKDEEKASILEKITGVDIYSKIGKKVYEITSEKERSWQHVHQQIKDVHILSDEEEDDLNTKLTELKARHTEIEKQRMALQETTLWLKTKAALVQKVRMAHESCAQAEILVNSEDYKQKKMLIHQWNATIDVRNRMNEISECERCEQLLLSNLKRRRNQFAILCSGLLWQQNMLTQQQDELSKLNILLEEYPERKEIFEQAPYILTNLFHIIEGRKKLIFEETRLADAKERTKSLSKQKEEKILFWEKAKEEYLLQEDAIRKTEEILKRIDLPTLRKHKELLLAKATDILQAQERREELLISGQRRDAQRKILEAQSAQLKTWNEETEKLKPELHDALIRYKAYKELYEKESDSADKWAKKVRAKLTAGDICPICLRKIGNLPDELEIDRLLADTYNAYKSAEQSYTDIQLRVQKILADISALSILHAEQSRAYNRDQTQTMCEQRYIDACQRCAIDHTDETVVVKLEQMFELTRKEMEQLEQKINEAEQIEQQIRIGQASMEVLRNRLEQSRQAVEYLEKTILKNESDIKASTQMSVTIRKDMALAENFVDIRMGDSTWTNDWKKDTEAFAAELELATRHYNQQKKRQQQLLLDVQQLTLSLNLVQQSSEAIITLMPEWKNETEVYPTQQDNLLNEFNELRSVIQTEKEQIRLSSDKKTMAFEYIKLFLDKHDSLTVERLALLDKYGSNDIRHLNETITSIEHTVLKRRSELAQLTTQLQEHEAKKPSMIQEDMEETISARDFYLEQELKRLEEEKATLTVNLKLHQENKNRLQTLLAEENTRHEEYRKWSGLNQLIGDATGNKFRKTAQSYVLGSLIHSANSYMRTLTDRYTLVTEPGKFVISIEDAYQGYTRRATSTISGGESFLVSLSLALALSDIGGRLAVDTLFIDEGFGTLSGEPLQQAISTLRTLHSRSGRKVGIISHIEELQERIKVQIKVEQDGQNSSSRIRIFSGR